MGAIVALALSLVVFGLIGAFESAYSDDRFRQAQEFCAAHRGIQQVQPDTLWSNAWVVCKDGAGDDKILLSDD